MTRNGAEPTGERFRASGMKELEAKSRGSSVHLNRESVYEHAWAGVLQSSDWNQVSNLILVAALLLTWLILRPGPTSGRRARPVPLEPAAARPGEWSASSCKKAIMDSSVEEQVVRLGEPSLETCTLSNAFAAELPPQGCWNWPGRGVRWISLNAPVTLALYFRSPDDPVTRPLERNCAGIGTLSEPTGQPFCA